MIFDVYLSGIYCQSKCSDGTYGNNCSKRCNCFKDGPCSQDSGICTCLRGMSGPNCNLPCQPGTYGLGCKEICDKPINPYGNIFVVWFCSVNAVYRKWYNTSVSGRVEFECFIIIIKIILLIESIFSVHNIILYWIWRSIC